MEDNFKPVAQPQRRLNPTMKEVVRKEVVKLLEAGMIYPISDSSWVSPRKLRTPLTFTGGGSFPITSIFALSTSMPLDEIL